MIMMYSLLLTLSLSLSFNINIYICIIICTILWVKPIFFYFHKNLGLTPEIQ